MSLIVDWPAAERNKQPILEVITPWLPASGTGLEIASATGQHLAHFAAALPHLLWQPSDCTDEHLTQLEARRAHAKLENLLPALRLDVLATPWPIAHADAIYNANMIHISEWATTLSLFLGAATLLAPGSPLITYGPYAIDGEHTSESNAAFDASLKSRNPGWGVRDLRDVCGVANNAGFELKERVAMPANNFTLLWVRR